MKYINRAMSLFAESFLLVLTCFCLTGCESESSTAPLKELGNTNNTAIAVYVDPETGVNYLILQKGYYGGITVRLNADGTPYVTSTE